MTLTYIPYYAQAAVMNGSMTYEEAAAIGRARREEALPPLSPEEWAAFCQRHGEDPDDPDAFCVTPPNRLRRMMAEFRASVR